MPQTHLHRTLVTIGDSWPQGGELKQDLGQVPYGNLMQDQLQFDKFYNYGTAGASNEDSIIQLYDFINNKWNKTTNVTAIIHLTNPARTRHFPKNWTHWRELDAYSDDRKHWPSDAKALLQQLVLHFFDDNHTVFRSSTTVSALQHLCKQYDIDDYYFSGWVKYPTWLSGVNTDKIWAMGNETAGDWFGATDHNGEHLLDVADNEYIRPNFCHPNHKGHSLIAKKLAEWIKL